MNYHNIHIKGLRVVSLHSAASRQFKVIYLRSVMTHLLNLVARLSTGKNVGVDFCFAGNVEI